MEKDITNSSTLDAELQPSETTADKPVSGDDKLSSERELISFNIQQLVDEINSKRKRDASLISEYKKALDEHTRLATEAVEVTIHEVCGSSNEVLDAKLQEVFVVLDNIEKLENELAHFKTAFSQLYSDTQPTAVAQ